MIPPLIFRRGYEDVRIGRIAAGRRWYDRLPRVVQRTYDNGRSLAAEMPKPLPAWRRGDPAPSGFLDIADCASICPRYVDMGRLRRRPEERQN